VLGSCAALDLELPGTARMLETARLKATHAIALADCFALATDRARGLTLLTGACLGPLRVGPHSRCVTDRSCVEVNRRR